MRRILIFVLVLNLLATVSVLAEQKPARDAAEQYKVGIDDILDISVIKPETITLSVTVIPDGTITFPYIGNVYVKGLTLETVQKEIQDRLANGYMQYPIVSVIARQIRSRKFTIYGQVKRPGTYPIQEDMTVIRALTMAGGFTVSGARGKIKLLRGNQATDIDINSILEGGKADTQVLNGDSLSVTLDRFNVYGEVRTPGAYPIQDNTTILRAITMAGGFTVSGARGRVKLLRPRSNEKGPEAVEIDINSILQGTKDDIAIVAGDTVMVTVDKFNIYGQVNRPGAYPVEENMTLLSAITAAGGFIEAGSAGSVKLLRTNSGTNKVEMQETDIGSIISGGRENVKIFPGDCIFVSADKFFVYGEVNRPGMYPLETNTTSLTAIAMAGGFTKFGSASRVKVLRMNKGSESYDTLRVKIKDAIAGNLSADVLLKPGDIVVVSEGVF